MIPICAWCKSVRADHGYWESVEQYVRSRTGAKFTHSICPACTQKMEADMKQNV